MNRGNVWVVERRKGSRFAIESGEPVGIVGEGGRKHLQRNVAS